MASSEKRPLKITHPSIAKEWDYRHNEKIVGRNGIAITPDTISYGSDKMVAWICPKGHSYQARISSRAINGTGCPFCSGQKAIPGENDLLSVHPEVMSIWDYEKNGCGPELFLPRSNKKVWWTCPRGHSYQAVINHKISRHEKCPYCSGKRVLKGFNDLATVSPQIAAEWDHEKNASILYHGETASPSNVSAGCNLRVWWKCTECHNSWMSSINDRTHGYGCPYCAGKNVKYGFNDLETKRSDLAAQWHPTKNGTLTPREVSCGSNKKVWWLCPTCGGEWLQSINNRNRGRKCPFCSGKKVLKGFNDLCTTHPSIAAMWHPAKNGDLLPTMVTKGSNKKVWWLCPVCGYEWQGMINGLNKCPACVGQAIHKNPDKVLKRTITGQKNTTPTSLHNKPVAKKYNDLATINPELAAEWHPTKNGDLTPSDVTCGTRKKVWWLCPICGYEWQSPICDRTRGNGCPRCNAGWHTSFPEQCVLYYLRQRYTALNRYIVNGDEIDIYLPNQKTGIEYNGMFYHQKMVEKDDAKKKRITDGGIRLLRIIEDNEYRIEGDDIYIIPKIKTKRDGGLDWGIHQLFRLLGTEPPMIDTKADEQIIREQYLFLIKRNNFASVFPEIAKQWHPTKNGQLKLDGFASHSNTRGWWKCPVCGGEWLAAISERASGRGCPVCAGYQVKIGFNDLPTTNPELVSEWDYEKNSEIGLDIYAVTRGSNKEAFWVCSECGYKWKSVINSRALRGGGCPECKKKKASKRLREEAAKKHSLKDEFPDVAAEWDYEKNSPLAPEDFAPGSNKKVWWICNKCGYEWATKICHRTDGHGCPACARRYVWEIRRQRKNQMKS